MMTRLSRDQKRGRSASGAASEGGAGTGTAPIEVRVPAAPGTETTVGGTPVAVGPDQEAQEVVLDHLHRRALATGRPVVATVHDERIGYVVAIRVYVDGSSEYAVEPVRMDTAGTADAPQAQRHDEPTHGSRPVDAEEPAPGASAPTFPLRAVPEPSGPSVTRPPTASRPSPPAGVPGGPGMPGVQSPDGGTGTSLPGAAPEPTGTRPARPAGPTSGAPSMSPPVPATPPTTPTARPVAPPATGAPGATAPQPAPAPASAVWASAPAAPDRPVPSPAAPPAPMAGPQPAPASPATARATGPVPSDRPASVPAASSVRSSPSAPLPPAAAPSSGQGPAPRPESHETGRDVAQGLPGGTVSTFVLRAVPEDAALTSVTPEPAQVLPAQDADGGRPTSTRGEAAPAPQAPGTVSAPTGTFGPPPVIPAGPVAPSSSQATPAPPSPMPLSRRATTGAPPSSAAVPPPAWPAPAPSSVETPEVLAPPATDADSEPDPYSAPDWKPTPPPKTVPVSEVEEEAKEPPVREFDSMAEAVLAPDSGAVPPDGAGGPIAEPMARINAAVKQGRIEEAAALAERTVADASGSLGDDHPDVLRLRELTAYIAYLATDVLRSFHLSLELARLRHRLGDSRGAYGNVQSAAAAWRAVRDPIQGLHLGRDLIEVWSELAASEGPAADDLDQLEQARNRMGRLADRARVAAAGEPPRPQ
ncbi:hypothetical protein ABZ359_32630 [Streptomyces sp. NPDC005968]|uniref:hypothetical protein n=1 Tax=Streptomyces sp. NPDC005968 TaxID=3154574 RepID=UPI00340C186E